MFHESPRNLTQSFCHPAVPTSYHLSCAKQIIPSTKCCIFNSILGRPCVLLLGPKNPIACLDTTKKQQKTHMAKWPPHPLFGMVHPFHTRSGGSVTRGEIPRASRRCPRGAPLEEQNWDMRLLVGRNTHDNACICVSMPLGPAAKEIRASRLPGARPPVKQPSSTTVKQPTYWALHVGSSGVGETALPLAVKKLTNNKWESHAGARSRLINMKVESDVDLTTKSNKIKVARCCCFEMCLCVVFIYLKISICYEFECFII
jgi:hypothetical protein